MFLLVLAHPGCPGQNPESHKMVVGVWVCMCYFLRIVSLFCLKLIGGILIEIFCSN